MISIVGNGAIGNLLALKCSQKQLPYQLIVRSKAPDSIVCHEQDQVTTLAPSFVSINALGYTSVDTHSKISPQTVDTHSGCDLLILPLKSYQIVDALKQLKPVISDKVSIVLLHNGMGPHESIQSILPDNPTIIATTSYGAYKPKIDQLNVTGIGRTQAGWLNNDNTNAKAEHIFDILLPPCQWHNNITQILWQKLAVNAVINPLTAMYDIPNGDLLRAEFAEHITTLCEEIARVMNALGMATTKAHLIERCMQVASLTATNFSSMCQDIRLGRRTEIDDINGYVVKQAKRLKIATPFSQHLYENIKKKEAL